MHPTITYIENIYNKRFYLTMSLNRTSKLYVLCCVTITVTLDILPGLPNPFFFGAKPCPITDNEFALRLFHSVWTRFSLCITHREIEKKQHITCLSKKICKSYVVPCASNRHQVTVIHCVQCLDGFSIIV